MVMFYPQLTNAKFCRWDTTLRHFSLCQRKLLSASVVSCIRLATTFSIRLEMKGRLDIRYQFFKYSLSNPYLLSIAALWWLVSNTTASLTHPFTYWQWLLSVTEVDPRIVFKIQVGSGSRSLDLFAELVIISLTSTSEDGRNISSIFPLNIISASTEIVHVLFAEWEISLFPMIVVFVIKKLLNVSARSSTVNVVELPLNYRSSSSC